MEFFPTTNHSAPSAFVQALQTQKPAYLEIVCEHLKIPGESLKPGALIVHKTGLVEEEDAFVHLKVTGVTQKDERDFAEAEKALASLIDRLAEEHWQDTSIHIFVVMEVLPEWYLIEHEAEVAVVDSPKTST